MKITEELWKGKGYVVVARNEKGQLEGWTKSDRPISLLKGRFKQTGSFKEGVRRTKYKNVIEIVNFNKKKAPKDHKFQVVMEGWIKFTDKDGKPQRKKIITRSNKDTRPYDTKKQEVEEDFRRACYIDIYKDYNPELSKEQEEEFLTKQVSSFKVGVVYYKAR